MFLLDTLKKMFSTPPVKPLISPVQRREIVLYIQQSYKENEQFIDKYAFLKAAQAQEPTLFNEGIRGTKTTSMAIGFNNKGEYFFSIQPKYMVFPATSETKSLNIVVSQKDLDLILDEIQQQATKEKNASTGNTQSDDDEKAEATIKKRHMSSPTPN